MVFLLAVGLEATETGCRFVLDPLAVQLGKGRITAKESTVNKVKKLINKDPIREKIKNVFCHPDASSIVWF